LTAQFPNTVILEKKKFTIAGFTNSGLITPKMFGLKPIVSSTACWRGFITTYKIDDESNFILEELLVKTEKKDEAIEINGIQSKSPTNKFDKMSFNRFYEKINLKVNYSGFILIATNFIKELYVHMGFHQAWKYETVFEIEVDKGKVISIVDLSEKISKIRKSIKEQKEKKTPPTKDEISKWVEDSFNQKYQKEKKKYGV
jgi:hypothetical protein